MHSQPVEGRGQRTGAAVRRRCRELLIDLCLYLCNMLAASPPFASLAYELQFNILAAGKTLAVPFQCGAVEGERTLDTLTDNKNKNTAPR